ncbi:DUF3313 domain-containing protein [Labrys sp. La1]|uniref:DUF3313 domain-containing protein n=1 Tax=Labrys sp. La1 TaxID=3404917 RepID=UPI003EBC6A48
MTSFPLPRRLAVFRIRTGLVTFGRVSEKATDPHAAMTACLRDVLIQVRVTTACLILPLLSTGCASVPLKSAGTLTSYDKLSKPKGLLSKSRNYVDASALASVKTVGIVPTTLTQSASARVKTPSDRAMVANALDREICVALSDKFQIVRPGAPADLMVRTVVTDIVPTNRAVAVLATAVTLGSGFALPVSVPRLPFGLGDLAVEAEAVDSKGNQRAAMLWARGANSISNKPRMSEVGDAYGLATMFGSEFSRMLVTGKEPRTLDIRLPSGQRIRSWLGGKPKYATCDSFGRAPGLLGVVAEKFGAPPEWTDKRPQAAPQR